MQRKNPSASLEGVARASETRRHNWHVKSIDVVHATKHLRVSATLPIPFFPDRLVELNSMPWSNDGVNEVFKPILVHFIKTH